MSKKKDISKKEIKKRIKLEDKIFKLILKSRSKKHPLDEQVYAVIDFLEQLQYSLKELVKEDEQKEQAETEKLIQEELPEPEVREEIKEEPKAEVKEEAAEVAPSTETPAATVNLNSGPPR